MKEDQKVNPQDYKDEVLGKPFYDYIDTKIGIWERKVKNDENTLELLHSEKDEISLPPVVKLPYGLNTHKVGEKGFKFGAKKFKGLQLSQNRRGEPIIIGGITKEEMGGVYIDSSLNKNASELALNNYEIVKEAWNELSDEDRELIDVLKFRFSNTEIKNMGSHVDRVETGGKIYTPAYIEIQLSNSLTTSTSAINTLVHEIAHAKWSKIEKENPEKVKKFNEVIREIGSPTPYVATYERDSENMEFENKLEKARRDYSKYSDESNKNFDETLERNQMNSELTYGNEAHSEFYSMINAPTLNYGHTISKEKMEKIAEAFKELHDIE